MITFKLLQWGNCFSYGNNNSIDFSASSLTQLLGKNGHGKSSIALILEEVLYNKNSKGAKKSDILNRYGSSKSYWIKLDFEKDSDIFHISTTRGATQNVRLLKNDEDISSHTSTGTYKQIEDIIGLDHKTFSQIVYQSSASSLEFLTATDTARKKFLIELLNLGIYTKASDVFKEVAGGISKELDKLGASKETVHKWLKKYSDSTLVALPIMDEPEVPSNIKEEKLQLSAKISSIIDINKKISNNNLYKQQLNSIKLDTATYNITNEDITALEVKKSELTKIVSDDKTFQVKHSKVSNSCPTCSQPVDNSGVIKMCVNSATVAKAAQTELDTLVVKLSASKKELATKKLAAESVASWEKYHALYDSKIDSELLVEEDLKVKLNEVTKVITNLETSIVNIKAANIKARDHNTKIQVLLEQKQGMLQEAAKLDIEISERSDKLNTLQLLVKTFSNSGLVSYKIECLVKDLENLTNEYLAELYAGRFQLSFQISSSDKLNVVITDNGIDVDISGLSSGERARVNVATLLAIRKLMQSLSNSKINLLVLDETISNLDTEGKDKLIEVLLSEENLNTILVSHDFSHPLLEKVSVIKENNISRIE